jgi:6-phosphogluconolactonase (cycloisomerase 2 family)
VRGRQTGECSPFVQEDTVRQPAALRGRVFGLLASISLVTLFAGNAAASQTGFVYGLQQVASGPNQIYGFSFNSSTGALTPLAGFPVPSGGTGPAGTTSSEHLAYFDSRLYVINDGDNSMTVFSVNRLTGALTAMPFSPVALGAGTWTCVAVHPSGSPVVVGNSVGTLASFVVTDTTATAAAGSPFAAGNGPISCAFSQDGNYVYGGGNFASSINGFSVNAGTGVLTALPGSPFDSGGPNPIGYATDSDGRLFSVMLTAAEVRGFATTSGVPAGVATNPTASGLHRGTHGVLRPMHLHGFFSFYMVADRSLNQVGVYQIAGSGAETTVSAVAGSPFAAGGTFTNALALTPTGTHLIAANGTSRNLTVFQVGSNTGGLTSMGVQAENTLGISGVITGLVYAPREAAFVYALRQVNGGSNQIHGFRLNPSTGTLTPLAGFPVASGGTGSFRGFSELIAYLNGRLYVVNDGSDTLTAFKVNRTTGALTALPFSPITLGSADWACVAVHPGGSPVVVGKGLGGISSFDINATTATAAAGSPFDTGTAQSWSCAFSNAGQYVYTGGSLGNMFAGFSVDSGTGVLTPLAGSPFDSGGNSPRGYATDGSGRLYMASTGDSGAPTPRQVRAFTTSGGVPTGVSGNPFSSGLTTAALHGVRHPSGFYMAVAPNRVGVYQIGGGGAATTLTAVSGSPFTTFGSGSNALALTEDGAFLVAANSSSRNLTVFRVNSTTGVLTLLGVQPGNTLGATGNVPGMAIVPVTAPFTDDPLTAFTSVIKAAHITELRFRIDAARAQYGLGPYNYADAKLTNTMRILAVHVSDLRAALGEVYTEAQRTQPTYTDPTLTPTSTIVKAAHIAELRAALVAIE